MRDQTRLVGVVLGGESAADRDRTMAELFDTAFMGLHILGPPPPPRPAVEVAELPPPPPGPTPTPAPAAPAEAVAGTLAKTAPNAAGWSVQVGAYRGYEGAQRRIQEAALALPLGFLHARPSIAPDPVDGLYHARLTGLTQAQATDACRNLEPAGIPCMVVAPGPVGPAQVDRAGAIAGLLRMLSPLGPAPAPEGGR